MDGLNTNDELDEKTKLLISQMEKELESKDQELESKDQELESKDQELESKDQEIDSKLKEINQLKNELEYLKAQILKKNKKMFGKSSEQVASNQISLFNEVEQNCDTKIEEPTVEEITYKRTKPSKNKGKKDNLANLEKITIEHKLEENQQTCDNYNSTMVEIGTKTKEIVKYEPARIYIEEHITYSYVCKSCEEEETPNIITTKAPNTLLHKSMASNELLSHVIYLKYQHAMPLYRQETYFKMMGVNLSRQTLSNWIIGTANEFEVAYDIMKEELLNSNYIQADETTVQVLNEDGTNATSKKYMWLYKTGKTKTPIILYDYQKTRSSSCPKNFLKGFKGYLQTDGYEGYNKVENVKRISCLAHIRRKYHEIVTTLDKEALKESKAIIGFNYCEKLYNIEKRLREKYSNKEDYYEKRYKLRKRLSAPILDEFIKYVEKELPDALPKSPLGKALLYSKNQLSRLKTFLEDGSIEIDNNGAERAIKPFVIGRKNWLFCNTTKGANASALIYSIIETAKSNKLKVEKYLVHLMNGLANIEAKNKDTLSKVMPWSKELPEELRIKDK